jgi:hypothetical protein
MADGTFTGPVYTPPIERSGAGDRKGESQMSAYNLMTLLLPMLQQQMQFGQQLQPQQQSLIQSLLNMNTPGGLNTADAGYRAQQMGSATDQGNLYAGLLGSQGVSQSGKAGATLYAQNNATKNSNAFSQNLRSPQNLFNMGNQSLNMIRGAQSPDLSGFQGLVSSIYGKPNPVSKPNMFGQALGGIAGTLLGNPGSLAGLFGGGGGGAINGQPMMM